jgi:hypothetical protein
MNTPEVELTELTEFSELSPDELHLVKRGANGVPALLAKSVAQSDVDAYAERLSRADPNFDLPKYHRLVAKQENPAVKESKAEKVAAKSLRTSMGQIRVRRNQEAVVKSVENATTANIARLEKALAKSPGQDGWQYAYQLHRAYADLAAVSAYKAAVPDMNDFNAVNRYQAAPAAAELNASRAATARAIGSAQGDPINAHLGRQSPLDVMRDVLNDSGQPESVRDYEAQTRRLEKALADATSPQERESLGYQVTRRKLLAMHRRGEG